ncbi:ChaB family protein [Methanolobus sp. WCC5]
MGSLPYRSINELPSNVKDNLPKHAREIYKEAFNNAWDQYADPEERRGDASREEVAHRVAWSAVKNKYEKNEKGDWVEK